jgi:superfamily II DNA or RNA helicase
METRPLPDGLECSLGIRDREFVITTHKTLSSEYFREKIQELDAEAVLIGDEVHRQGSESYRKGLVDEFTARIGLSATPERYYDEEGSEFLVEYFDNVIYTYTLGQAIPEHLTPYEYNPIIVEMNSDVQFDLTAHITPKNQERARNELQDIADDLQVDADLEQSVRSAYLQERANEAAATHKAVENGANVFDQGLFITV